MPDFPGPAAPRRRFWSCAVLAVLVLAGAGWTGLWFFAAEKVNQKLDAWLEEERQLGHEWLCGQRSLAGFPLQIEFTCAQPEYRADSDFGPVVGKALGLRAVASVLQPDRVSAEIQGPLTIATLDGDRQVRLEWASARFSLTQLLAREPQLDAEISQAAITSQVRGAPGHAAQADSLNVHVQRNPDRPAKDRALDAMLTIGQLTSATLDGIADSKTPADFTAQATLTQVHAGQDLTFGEWLEIWRKAGGQASLSAFSLAKGPMRLGGQGQFSLDGQHRMQGQITLNAAGMEPVLARFGVPSAMLNVGGLLSGLLGGGNARAAPPPGDGVRLALKLDRGGVFLGPVKLPVTLLPLY